MKASQDELITNLKQQNEDLKAELSELSASYDEIVSICKEQQEMLNSILKH